jgi:AraC-like DNA-binding protein
MLCIRIGKSVFHVFMDLDRLYLQIGLSACMMIGPFAYLYIHHFLSKEKRFGRSSILHIAIPLLLVITTGIIWPYETQPEAWNTYIVKSIYTVWFVYMIFTTFKVVPLMQKAVKKQTAIEEQWILLVYACVSLICIAYILAYFGIPYLAGPILFSLVFYVLMIFLLVKKNRSSIISQEATKYQGQKVGEEKADNLLLRLSKMMKTEQPYLNPKIKLSQIAQAVEASPHEVSQVINNRLDISFNHYINEYRIQTACQLLEDADHLTMEGIGKESGFNSKSAFYLAFKTIKQQTPAQYKARLKTSKV